MHPFNRSLRVLEQAHWFSPYSNQEMAAEKFLTRIANVKFGRKTQVTTFSNDASISNTFKLALASDSESRMLDSRTDMVRETLNKYRQQGWKYAPLDFTRSSQAPSRFLVKTHFPLKAYLHHYRKFHTKAKLAARREEYEKHRVIDVDTMFYFAILGLFIYMVSIINLLTRNWRGGFSPIQ